MKKLTTIFEMTGTLYTKEAGREAGWTESWYSPIEDMTGPVARLKAARLHTARALLLAAGGRITGYRWHDLATNASVAYVASFPGQAPDNDMPQMAVLGRAYGGGGVSNNRAIELRGFPDAWVVRGELQEFQTFRDAWTAFEDALVLDQWALKGINKTIPRFKVDTVEVTGGKTAIVHFKEPTAGWTVGGRLKFYRTKEDGTCCGSLEDYEIGGVTDAQTVTLKQYTRGDAHGGKAGMVPPIIYPAVVKADYERSDVRKAGRPFDLFRGRTSRKCCKC